MRSAFSARRISRMIALLRRSRLEIGFAKRICAFEGHDTALQNLTIEAADQVLIRFVLIFSSNFNCHTEVIISNEGKNDNPKNGRFFGLGGLKVVT